MQEEQITSPIVRFFRYIFDPDARAEYKARKKLAEEPLELDFDADLSNIGKEKEVIKVVEPREIKIKKKETTEEEIMELFTPEEQM